MGSALLPFDDVSVLVKVDVTLIVTSVVSSMLLTSLGREYP